MRPISGSAAGGATSDLAITAGGQTLNFYLSPKRNVAAAKRFLAKTLRSNASAGSPQVKYLNNVIDGDHGRLKPILGPKGAFKNLTSAYRTLKGMEAMHSLRKGQGRMFALTGNRTRTR